MRMRTDMRFHSNYSNLHFGQIEIEADRTSIGVSALARNCVQIRDLQVHVIDVIRQAALRPEGQPGHVGERAPDDTYACTGK